MGVLDDIDAQLSGLHQTAVKEYGGHKFTFRTTDPSEHRWAAGAIGGFGDSARAIGVRTATLATALVAIDDKSVEVLWEPSKAQVQALIEQGVDEKEARTAARRIAIAAWFDDSHKHPSFVELLYRWWLDTLDKPRRDGVAKLDPTYEPPPAGG